MKISDVLDAIEKNGLPKITGAFLQTDDGIEWDNRLPKYGKFTGGCALGQAARNLNLAPRALCERINLKFPTLATEIVFLNDSTRLTLPEIANRVRADHPDLLDIEI